MKTNEKKHPIIYPIWLVTMDRLAAYTLHHFFVIRRFCADAGRDRKHYPVGLYQKGEENIRHYLSRFFYLEHTIHLLGV